MLARCIVEDRWPQTNGKVERFNRTLLEEWAYARAYRSGPNAWPLFRRG